MFADTVTISKVDGSEKVSLYPRQHRNDLSHTEKSDQVIFSPPKTEEQSKTSLYLYTFDTSDGVPEMLGILYITGFDEGASHAVRAVSAPVSLMQASSAGTHSSVMADVESSAEEVVRAPIDDGVTGKEFAVRHFEPQTYRRKEV